MGIIFWLFLAKFFDWHTGKENTPDSFMELIWRILLAYFNFFKIIAGVVLMIIGILVLVK